MTTVQQNSRAGAPCPAGARRRAGAPVTVSIAVEIVGKAVVA